MGKSKERLFAHLDSETLILGFVLISFSYDLVRVHPSLAQVPFRVVQGRLERVDQIGVRLVFGFEAGELGRVHVELALSLFEFSFTV